MRISTVAPPSFIPVDVIFVPGVLIIEGVIEVISDITQATTSGSVGYVHVTHNIVQLQSRRRIEHSHSERWEPPPPPRAGK